MLLKVGWYSLWVISFQDPYWKGISLACASPFSTINMTNKTHRFLKKDTAYEVANLKNSLQKKKKAVQTSSWVVQKAAQLSHVTSLVTWKAFAVLLLLIHPATVRRWSTHLSQLENWFYGETSAALSWQNRQIHCQHKRIHRQKWTSQIKDIKYVSEGLWFDLHSIADQHDPEKIWAVSNTVYWLNPKLMLMFLYHPSLPWLTPMPASLRPGVVAFGVGSREPSGQSVRRTDRHSSLHIPPFLSSHASLGPSGLYIRPHMLPPTSPSI